jgi:hypothetical protein
VQGYRAYCDGKTLNEAFAPCLTGVLGKALTVRATELNSKAKPQVGKLAAEIAKVVTEAKPTEKVAPLWKSLEPSARAVAAAMQQFGSERLSVDKVERQFFNLFAHAETVPVLKPDPISLCDWVQVTFAEVFDQTMVPVMVGSLAVETKTWATNVPVKIDPPLDLSAYKSKEEPWNKDLSRETIADLPAAHQAYDGDKMWWRYSGSARSSTNVSDYQWRAPGEWFAEIYAISWFKKVEPPSAVAGEFRPYLFGGSMPP